MKIVTDKKSTVLCNDCVCLNEQVNVTYTDYKVTGFSVKIKI